MPRDVRIKPTLVATILLLFWAGPWVSLALCQPVASLKIMTFNVWSGESTLAGRNKIVQIIQAADADIVGIQELDSGSLNYVATQLGFHSRQQSGGDIQVLSRYPIVGNSPGGLGVRIAPSPDQELWLFNAHLAAYPYQPYDLRDGVIPRNEPAVIAAANSARGAGVTSYLNDMNMSLGTGLPVFFTGDFNEPSHLDWTAAAANATPRPFDLKVAYPASSRIVAAGMTDSFRTVRPNEVADPAYTWTPGYPPPTLGNDEVHDRIDIIYHKGHGVIPTAAWTVGFDANDGMTDIAVPGYNADHRAVVVEFQIPACFVFADLNLDCSITAQDWLIFRGGQLSDMSSLSADQAYMRGDLNHDFRNDYADFRIFKETFENRNGSGSFEAMLLSVPEPGMGVPLLMLLFYLAGLAR